MNENNIFEKFKIKKNSQGLVQTKGKLLLYMVVSMAWVGCSKNDSNTVEINQINNQIVLDIKYATKDNFLGVVIYTTAKAKLVKEVAQSLSLAQIELNQYGYGLKVWDAYRPMAAQEAMWKVMPDERYVSNPAKGGRHTRGTAVDVTLIDRKTGKELAMPTPFDEFSERAHRSYVQTDLEIKKNVELLESVMLRHGFIGLPTEWWHFDYQNWQNYPVISEN